MQEAIRRDRVMFVDHFKAKGLIGNFLHAKAAQEHVAQMKQEWRLLDGGREAGEREGAQASKDQMP